jgi:hypothetical protein
VIPLFMGAGGLAGKPYDTILGRPAYASELCEAVGTVGDIMAIVPSEYHMIGSGAQSAESIHVRFLYGENTLKLHDPHRRRPGVEVLRHAVQGRQRALAVRHARRPLVTL